MSTVRVATKLKALFYALCNAQHVWYDPEATLFTERISRSGGIWSASPNFV